MSKRKRRYTVERVLKRTEGTKSDREKELGAIIDCYGPEVRSAAMELSRLTRERIDSLRDDRQAVWIALGAYIYIHREDIFEYLLNDRAFQHFASCWEVDELMGLPHRRGCGVCHIDGDDEDDFDDDEIPEPGSMPCHHRTETVFGQRDHR